MLSKEYQVLFFESLVWLNLGLDPGLPGHWQTMSHWNFKTAQFFWFTIICSLTVLWLHVFISNKNNSYPNIYIYIYIYIFTNPLHISRMRHKMNFKLSLTDLKSEFSFSKSTCHTKVEEISLPYYLPVAEGRILGFILFSENFSIYVKCKKCRTGFEFMLPCLFPVLVTFIPRTNQNIWLEVNILFN